MTKKGSRKGAKTQRDIHLMVLLAAMGFRRLLLYAFASCVCFFAPLRELMPHLLLFMLFNDSQWRREEIKLLAQAILQVAFVGKMQSRLAA